MCLTVSTKTSKTNCTNSIRAQNRGYRQHGTSATYQTALTTYIMFVHVRLPETFKRTAKKSQSEGERERERRVMGGDMEEEERAGITSTLHLI